MVNAAGRSDSGASEFPRPLSILADRLDPFPPWVLLIQAFLGLGWLRAGVEKAIDGDWWRGEFLADVIDTQQGVALFWYQPFLNALVIPGVVFVSFLVLAAEFFVSAALLSGRRQGVALGIAMFLNLNFIALGVIVPSIFYLLGQGAIVLWLAEQSRRDDLTKFYAMAAFYGAALAGISIPFISTLEPAEVINDPAIVMATAGFLAAAMALELRRRHLPYYQPAHAEGQRTAQSLAAWD